MTAEPLLVGRTRRGRLKRAGVLGVLLLNLGHVACGDDATSGPSSACEFSGITPTDASGMIVGPADPDDWCAGVAPARPNPASAATFLRVDIPQEQRVQVWVSGLERGRLKTLVDDVLPAGGHALTWDMTTDSGARVEPGIYCVTVVTDEYTCTGDVDVR
jgi:hypothetical protein